ncbi:ATP-dependent RNA helicase DBP5 [Tritrichomonas foetus]|uniref:RNA helicase n=1 Tax=Tritrichomonas foetus TaxID=1144522 RepID=A0A1J4KAG1_9EUKA|nr:ATP-dependent RNA helicase DBP5 [Tritrichomonas foetus]|eukprot:OHT08415.1 ATP-dependent RNA helicase DBP5 [Tritrichomonas foetus]
MSQSNAETLRNAFKAHEDYASKLELSQNDKESPLYPMLPFDEIIKGPVADPLLQILDELEFYQPSKIQSQAIPILNDGDKKDLIAQAQSGSGKTVAFIVSMILHVNPEVKKPQSICLCHTRELSEQTFKVFESLNKYTKYTAGRCVKNVEDPSPDAQVIFGTAASFVFAIREKKIDPSEIKFLVVDEADTILEKDGSHRGPTTMLIQKLLPKDCQLGMFSATFPPDVIGFIHKLRPNIISIRLKRSQQHVATVSHWYTKVNDDNEGYEVVYDLTNLRAQGQTYIFVPSKNAVNSLTKYLTDKGLTCRAFSSDLEATERDATLNAFRRDEFKVLITTDVLARGIDIPTTYLVINYRLPQQFDQAKKRNVPSCDSYYHRAGRAGRFGRTGLCFNIIFASTREEQTLKIFCDNLGIKPLNKISKEELKTLPDETEVPTEVAPAAEEAK